MLQRILERAEPEEWGLSLLNHTGSSTHLDDLRAHAQKRRIAWTAKTFGRKATDEAAVYAKLGLRFIEPELREDRGEVQAAASDELPKLVTLEDLRGDLQAHH